MIYDKQYDAEQISFAIEIFLLSRNAGLFNEEYAEFLAVKYEARLITKPRRRRKSDKKGTRRCCFEGVRCDWKRKEGKGI